MSGWDAPGWYNVDPLSPPRQDSRPTAQPPQQRPHPTHPSMPEYPQDRYGPPPYNPPQPQFGQYPPMFPPFYPYSPFGGYPMPPYAFPQMGFPGFGNGPCICCQMRAARKAEKRAQKQRDVHAPSEEYAAPRYYEREPTSTEAEPKPRSRHSETRKSFGAPTGWEGESSWPNPTPTNGGWETETKEETEFFNNPPSNNPHTNFEAWSSWNNEPKKQQKGERFRNDHPAPKRKNKKIWERGVDNVAPPKRIIINEQEGEANEQTETAPKAKEPKQKNEKEESNFKLVTEITPDGRRIDKWINEAASSEPKPESSESRERTKSTEKPQNQVLLIPDKPEESREKEPHEDGWDNKEPNESKPKRESEPRPKEKQRRESEKRAKETEWKHPEVDWDTRKDPERLKDDRTQADKDEERRAQLEEDELLYNQLVARKGTQLSKGAAKPVTERDEDGDDEGWLTNPRWEVNFDGLNCSPNFIFTAIGEQKDLITQRAEKETRDDPNIVPLETLGHLVLEEVEDLLKFVDEFISHYDIPDAFLTALVGNWRSPRDKKFAVQLELELEDYLRIWSRVSRFYNQGTHSCDPEVKQDYPSKVRKYTESPHFKNLQERKNASLATVKESDAQTAPLESWSHRALRMTFELVFHPIEPLIGFWNLDETMPHEELIALWEFSKEFNCNGKINDVIIGDATEWGVNFWIEVDAHTYASLHPDGILWVNSLKTGDTGEILSLFKKEKRARKRAQLDAEAERRHEERRSKSVSKSKKRKDRDRDERREERRRDKYSHDRLEDDDDSFEDRYDRRDREDRRDRDRDERREERRRDKYSHDRFEEPRERRDKDKHRRAHSVR